MDSRFKPSKIKEFKPISEAPTVNDNADELHDYIENRKVLPLRENEDSDTIDYLCRDVDESNVEHEVFPEAPRIPEYDSFSNAWELLNVLSSNRIAILSQDEVSEYITPMMLNESSRFQMHIVARVSFLESMIVSHASDHKRAVIGYINAYNAKSAKEKQRDSPSELDLPIQYYLSYILNLRGIEESASLISNEISYLDIAPAFRLREDIYRDDRIVYKDSNSRTIMDLVEIYEEINRHMTILEKTEY
jgi:hypothetical protein